MIPMKCTNTLKEIGLQRWHDDSVFCKSTYLKLNSTIAKKHWRTELRALCTPDETAILYFLAFPLILKLIEEAINNRSMNPLKMIPLMSRTLRQMFSLGNG